MSAIQNFFIFCSGVHPSLLNRTPSDTNKYIGIGATIFFTGLLAFVASAFAIHTIFDSYIAAIVFGLIWGMMIFNLDRFIVSSMKNRGSTFRNFTSAIPRFVLAIIIAMVISKPLELKIFQSEIAAETVSMEQERYKEQEQLLKSRFEDDILLAKTELTAIQSEITAAESYKNKLYQEALTEADGTGGSKIRNMGPIYKAKIAAAEKADQEYLALTESKQPDIDLKKQAIANLENNQAVALAELKQVNMTGFAAQLDALGRLTSKSETIWWASLFITLLFICIETTPILAKLMSNRSPYDLVLHKLEHSYEMNHRSIVTKLSLDTEAELDYLSKTKAYQSKQMALAENELFRDGLSKKLVEEKEKTLGWAEILKGGRLRID